MTEYSRMAQGSFTAPASTYAVNLPFAPDAIELWNYTNIATPGSNKVVRAWWDKGLVVSGNNPTMVELITSTSPTVLNYDVIANSSSALAINPFYAGLSLQFGATQQIIGITKASAARVNVTAHGYSVGDTVIMQGLALATTNNMQLLNGVPFTIVTVSDADHFDIKWDSTGSNYTAISASPAGALVKKVLYPFLYAPEDNVVTAVTTGSTTTITTSMYSNFEVGQEIAFRVPSFWGPTGLNSLPNLIIPGSPIYGYVVSVTDNWTFVCNINSSAFTSFSNNGTMTAATLPGLNYMQVVPVGDVNTGGNLITSTSPLYPSPQFPASTNRVPTINGPAIRGAFVNNTSQGFTIGAGKAATNGTATIMSTSDVVVWRAFLHDINSP